MSPLLEPIEPPYIYIYTYIDIFTDLSHATRPTTIRPEEGPENPQNSAVCGPYLAVGRVSCMAGLYENLLPQEATRTSC